MSTSLIEHIKVLPPVHQVSVSLVLILAAIAGCVPNTDPTSTVGAVYAGGGQSLTITQDPQSATVRVGQPATFSVAASEGTPPYKYQWQKNDQNIPGATQNPYTTPAIDTVDNNADFRVIVTDSTNRRAVSKKAKLVVSVGVPSLNVTPSSLSFAYTINGATPPSQQITVTISEGTAVWTATTSGGNWLSVFRSGSIVTVSVNPTGIAAATYNGSVTVTAPGAQESPKTIPVTLTVNPAGGQTTFYFNPAHPVERIWGVGFGGADLSNIPVDGQYAGPVAYSFISTQTASITHWRGWIKTYFASSYLSAWQSGAPTPGGGVYGWGSGGDIRLKIYTDNNGKPGSPVSASEVRMYHLLWVESNVKPSAPPNNGSYYGDHKRFEKWAFSAPIPVTAGTKYWLYFANVDPDPVNNFASINNFWMGSGPLAVTNQAWRFTAGSWQKYGNDFPISEVHYDNAMVDGPGHNQGNNSGGAGSIKLTQTAGIREVWTQVGDVRVGDFGLRIKQEAGSGMRLSVYEDNVALVSGVADAAQVYPADDEGYVWRRFPFSATFRNGKSYRVEIFGASGSKWASAVVSKGDGYGFRGHFQGYAEYTTNSGNSWNDWPQWGSPSGHGQNLSFYFDY